MILILYFLINLELRVVASKYFTYEGCLVSIFKNYLKNLFFILLFDLSV